MEHNLVVGVIVGLVTFSSIYVWNNEKYTGAQKSILLLLMVFPPAQWLGILLTENFASKTPEKNLVEQENWEERLKKIQKEMQKKHKVKKKKSTKEKQKKVKNEFPISK